MRVSSWTFLGLAALSMSVAACHCDSSKCAKDTDCPSAARFCLAETCVECLRESDCPTEQFCGVTPTPVSPAEHVCVDCREDSDCRFAGERCRAGFCWSDAGVARIDGGRDGGGDDGGAIDATVGDAGIEGDAGSCSPRGPCESAADCCSGSCVDGDGVLTCACLATGAACSPGACCAGSCEGGICTVMCTPDGDSCAWSPFFGEGTLPGPCCTESAGGRCRGGACRPASDTCTNEGGVCATATADACCSGRCGSMFASPMGLCSCHGLPVDPLATTPSPAWTMGVGAPPVVSSSGTVRPGRYRLVSREIWGTPPFQPPGPVTLRVTELPPHVSTTGRRYLFNEVEALPPMFGGTDPRFYTQSLVLSEGAPAGVFDFRSACTDTPYAYFALSGPAELIAAGDGLTLIAQQAGAAPRAAVRIVYERIGD